MTIQELSQLKRINKEIAQLRRRLEDLESRPYQMLGCVQASTKSPPYNLHTETIQGEIDESIREEIGEIKAELRHQLRKCLAEQLRLERWINAIPDSILRQIFRYRYVNGLDWGQVAYSIGGNTTEGSVKMAHKRYLEDVTHVTNEPAIIEL